MKLTFEKYPLDLLILIIWGIILLPIILLTNEVIFHIIIGFPLLFFIPGYLLIYCLYPTKNSINILERIGLSIGFSIAVVSLLGLVMNYTPWGIRLEPILLFLFFIVEGLGLVALYRWKTTNPQQRIIFTFNIPLARTYPKIDNILTILVALSIIIALGSIIYIIITPKTGEVFTELYILPADRNTTNYPQVVFQGENISLLIGLLNHEYKTINYTVEIWLINETIAFNKTTNANETIYNHAWFMQKINIMLNAEQITNEKPYSKQWEFNYTFSINKNGHFKLDFLLFKTSTLGYSNDYDYVDIIQQRINDAYRDTHLWLYVV